MTINASPIATQLRSEISDSITAEVLTFNMQDGAGTNIATDGSLNLGTLPTMAMVGTNGLWANAGWMTSSGDNYIKAVGDAVVDNFFDLKEKDVSGFLILLDFYKASDIVTQSSALISYGQNGTANNVEGAILLTIGTNQKFTSVVYGSDGAGGTATLWQKTGTQAIANATKYTVGIFLDTVNGQMSHYINDDGIADASIPFTTDTTILPTIAGEGFALWGRATTTIPTGIVQSGVRTAQLKVMTFDTDMSSKIGQIVADQYNLPWDYSWEMENAG